MNSRPLAKGESTPATTAPETSGMVHIPAGTFQMGNPRGDGYPADGEDPVYGVSVDPFGMDATAVTNASFAAFVEATGYVTDAERCD